MIRVRSGGATDVGRVRAKNQDSWITTDRLFVVADGMGGHKGGEVAAGMAVDVLVDKSTESTAASLVNAAHEANDAIFEKADGRSDLRGMGTTLCAMALVVDDDGDDEFAVINVGDSRMYVLRDDELTQVTRDHSLVEDMRASGQITAEEAAVHPHRNIVTRALGIGPTVDVDEFIVIPQTDDRYVLCSDGLFNEVSSDQIAATMRRLSDPQDTAAELVRLANEGGGRDNITCVIVQVDDDHGRSDRAEAAGVASIRRRPDKPDVAGFTTADSADDDADSSRTRAHAAVPSESAHGETHVDSIGDEEIDEILDRTKLRRFTWRTFLFLVVLLAILAAAAAAIGWYSRGTFFVGFDQSSQVTIYKGRPGGFLWFDPTVEVHTGIAKSQVPPINHDAIAKGKEFGSQAAAQAYLTQMRTMICSNLRNGAKPPKSSPGSPSITIPEECEADFSVTTTTTTVVQPSTSAPTTVAPTTSAGTAAP